MLFKFHRVRNGFGEKIIRDEFTRTKTETEKGLTSIFFLSTLNSNHFSGKRFVAFIQSYLHQEDPKLKRRAWKKVFPTRPLNIIIYAFV